MDKEQIIFDIDVRYEDAIEGIIKYQEEINRARKDQELFKSELAKGIITKKEYTRAIIESNAVIAKGKDSIRTLTREVKNNIAIENERTGSIKSLQAELSNLYATYDRLSKTDRDSKLGAGLLGKISETRLELIKAEEASGRFQRNVGSYKLLSRDMVSALQQVNPALGTMINRLQNSNVYAQTLGKTTEWLTNTFKLSAASAMTLQLALGGLVAVGVYALIKAFKSYQEEQKEVARLNGIVTDSIKKASLEGQKSAQKELSNLNLLYKATQDETKSKKERLKVAGELQKQYPSYLGNLSKEEIVAGKGATAYKNLANAIIESAKARAYADKIAENQSKIIELETKKSEAEEKKKQAEIKLEIAAAQSAENERAREMQSDATVGIHSAAVAGEIVKAKNEIDKYGEEISNTTKEIDKLNESTTKLAGNINFSALVEDPKGGTKGGKNNQKIELQRLYEKTMDDLIEESEEKRRAIINRQYKNQVEDLKKKHGKDKDSQELLNKTIIALAAKRDQDLQALEEDSIKKRAEIIEKDLANQLEVVKKHSDEELALKVKSIEAQRSKELAEAEKLGLDLVAINKKYDDQITDAESEAEQYRNEQSKLAFQNKIAEAKARGEQVLALEIEAKQRELETITQLESESDEEYKARRLAIIQEIKDAEAELTQQQIDDSNTILSAYAAMFGAMSDLLGEFAENSESLSAFSKALALVEIGFNTAKAISAGIASAQSVPFPANLAATAATVASVLANITQAKKILSSQKSPKAPKFATGGLVTGPGSGTSDSIPAHLSNGESVMTALATQMFSPMLSAFNQIGGGVPISPQSSVDISIGEDVLARAFAKGAMMLPPQSVSVQEINSVSNRVDVLENSRVL